MIESISIADIATYGSTPETLSDLKDINYIFGSNGAGKTTIGRVIADELSHSTCVITWKRGIKLQTLVYNQQFIERNFLPSTELKGVFTLGEHQVDTIQRIDRAKNEVAKRIATIANLTTQLMGANGKEGKQGERDRLQTKFQDKCWQQKLKLDGKLMQEALRGSMKGKLSFCEKILEESTKQRGTVETLENLELKAESLFSSMPTEAVYFNVDLTSLTTLETNAILEKRIFGKEDVDIAAMIQKLNNSDWVREGRAFFEKNDDICPFCQQKTSSEFSKSLGEYFDETFSSEVRAFNEFVEEYEAKAFLLEKQLSSLIEVGSTFLDIDRLKRVKDLIDANVVINKQRLSEKQKEVSQIVQLESLVPFFSELKAIFDSANDQIRSHNQIVANLTAERNKFKGEVWTYILAELAVELADYRLERGKLDTAINALEKRIQEVTNEKTEKEREIRELESGITSIVPTINAINELLLAYGFRGFKLAQADGGRTYKLIRADGTDAMATLSEGEKTFITFLYFYHLLKGSASETGITANRVVVFDDPVSSLDSNVLFIVSSLIRAVFDEIRKGSGLVKQVFVLTHNIYFHKEVTYSSNRDGDKRLKDETFWIVRKPSTVSSIEYFESNPIRTSYQWLWEEVRRRTPSNFGIQNNLRRILEYYFKILGGVNFEALIDKFTGSDRIICKSLISWAHDGSHFSLDDLYVSLDEPSVENHLRIFKSIFEKTDNIGHYNMMIGLSLMEQGAAEPLPQDNA